MGIVSSVAALGGLPRVLQGLGLCAAAVGPGPDGPEPPGLGGFRGAEVRTLPSNFCNSPDYHRGGH